ncbi:DNA/RNA nuclease SfsA [Gynuella sp.]|uniref:DNA/RNA nuclease SfsA n=1 Tax=Gynuella sp. TaxID=2969146 RepID=UPI003D111AEC
MQFDRALVEGRLVRRYKRFFMDAELPDGRIVTAHCPNTGSMKNLLLPGAPVWLLPNDDPKRKLRYTWELLERKGEMIAVNTQRANALVAESLREHWIAELADYQTVRSEVRYGQENSRIDFLLQQPGLPDCYVEVKNVTLMESDGHGYFPDAVTSRGQKHLRELTLLAQQGYAAVLLFHVAHSGIKTVRAAGHIDPQYAAALVNARQAGVRVLCYGSRVSVSGIYCDVVRSFEED